LGTAQDMDDHWQAMQIGKWLAGQTRGGEARRDEDHCVWHRGCRKSRPHVAPSKVPQALIRVAMGEANRYLIAATGQVVLAPHCLAPLRELAFDEFLRTKQDPRRHPRHLLNPARAQYWCWRHFRA